MSSSRLKANPENAQPTTPETPETPETEEALAHQRAQLSQAFSRLWRLAKSGEDISEQIEPLGERVHSSLTQYVETIRKSLRQVMIDEKCPGSSSEY